MTRELITGLQKAMAARDRGALEGLKAVAAAVTEEMRTTHPHGNVTGAAEAGYGARAVGVGENGAAQFAQEVAAASALNPAHIATGTVTMDGIAGVIVDSKVDYQKYLEEEHAGRDAVLVPTLRANGTRFTRGAAQGMKKAWGG